MQDLFDQLAAEQRAAKEAVPKKQLLTLDEERQRLSQRVDELELDKQKFDEAAVRLGKEKAALEVKFLCVIVTWY